MGINRRMFIAGAAVTLVVLDAHAADTPPPAPAPPTDGFRVVTARAALARIMPAPARETEILGFDGLCPGPLIRVRQGTEVKLRLVNALPEPTTLHVHCMRAPNAMCGAAPLAQAAIEPGASFDYRFTAQDSGLAFYHPLAGPNAAAQAARGLFGLLIVDEPDPPKVDRDIILALDAWTLDAAGQPAAGAVPLATANAKPLPETIVAPPGARVRLRLLNAAPSRLMVVSFAGFKPLIAAIDGQPCDAFEPLRQTIPVGPGARFDLFFDLPSEAAPPASVILRGEPGPDGRSVLDQTIAVFTLEGERGRPAPPIGEQPLVHNPALPPQIKLQEAKRLDLVVDGAGDMRTLNGLKTQGAPADKPLFSVKRGAPVSLGLVNKTGVVHAVYVHGHVMRLLHDLDDGWEPYWRDTVLVPSGKTKHVAFNADNPGKWMIQCIQCDGTLGSLAGWFEVS